MISGPWPARAVVVLGCLVVFAWTAAVFWSMEHSSYDRWGALLVVAGVVALSAPMFRSAARRDGGHNVLLLLWAALCAKLLASAARWVVAFRLYEGEADSVRYHNAGLDVAASLRDGVLPGSLGDFTNSRFLDLANGAVYVVTGPTLIGAFVVFAWGALWGQWFFYRAYRTAFPDAPAGRFAVLVMLWPSLLFWPSSVGKESVMILALGIAAYGAARVYAGRLGGLWPLLLGTFLATVVRPHMGLMIAAATVAGLLVYRPRRRTALTPVLRLGALGAAAAGLGLLTTRATQYFAASNFDVSSLSSVIAETSRRTTVGGSEFTPTPVLGPAQLPQAAMTVLFRPYPWEAHSVVTLMAAAECLLLMGVLALSWRRLVLVPGLALRVPIVAMSVVFVLEFIVAFSTFGNFGLLTRERTQVLPYLLLLACVPAVTRPRPPARPHVSRIPITSGAMP